MAALLLISNCSALWNSGRSVEAGVLSVKNGGQKGLHMAGEPLGPIQFQADFLRELKLG